MPPDLKARSALADVIGNAVRVMQIATGEIEDNAPDDRKNAAAKALGAKGGAVRAAFMAPERRAEIEGGGRSTVV